MMPSGSSRPRRLAWCACAVVALVALTGVALASGEPRLITSGEGSSKYRLQAKINWVDMSQAPKVRIFASLLDRRFKTVALDDIKRVTVTETPRRGDKTTLFTIDREQETVVWPEEFAHRADEEVQPTLTLGEEQLDGMASVVVVNGYDGTIDESSPGYRDSELGARVLGGVSLFFQQLGKANMMNVIWYSDALRMWIDAPGRQGEFTYLSPQIRSDCEQAVLEVLEEPSASDEAPSEAKITCGLTKKYENFLTILETGDNVFEGAYPRLFNLDWRPYTSGSSPGDYCRKPEVKRRKPRKLMEDDEEDAEAEGDPLAVGPWVSEPSAMDLALEMLIRDAGRGQQKTLILLSDGKDGYVHRLRECKTQWRLNGPCRSLRGRAGRDCINEWLKKAVVQEQSRFSPKAERWIGLAKAAGVRIFSVVHPMAETHERERLEVLLSRLADGQNADGHAAVGGHAYAGYSWGAFEWIDSLLKCAERYEAADATKILAARRRQLRPERRRVPRVSRAGATESSRRAELCARRASCARVRQPRGNFRGSTAAAVAWIFSWGFSRSRNKRVNFGSSAPHLIARVLHEKKKTAREARPLRDTARAMRRIYRA